VCNPRPFQTIGAPFTPSATGFLGRMAGGGRRFEGGNVVILSFHFWNEAIQSGVSRLVHSTSAWTVGGRPYRIVGRGMGGARGLPTAERPSMRGSCLPTKAILRDKASRYLDCSHALPGSTESTDVRTEAGSAPTATIAADAPSSEPNGPLSPATA